MRRYIVKCWRYAGLIELHGHSHGMLTRLKKVGDSKCARVISLEPLRCHSALCDVSSSLRSSSKSPICRAGFSFCVLAFTVDCDCAYQVLQLLAD